MQKHPPDIKLTLLPSCHSYSKRGLIKPLVAYRSVKLLTASSEARCHHLDCFLRGVDWNDLKVDEVIPQGDPFLQQIRFIALHQLEAATKALLHPTGVIMESCW